jgi:cell envelope opacity-associated protein A
MDGEGIPHEQGIRVANRVGPQAHELPWSSVEPVVPHRPRWPFTVMRKEHAVMSKNDSPKDLNNSNAPACFTT